MTYNEFKTEYNASLTQMMKYSPKEVGAEYYAEKMGALVDAYPEYETRLDNES